MNPLSRSFDYRGRLPERLLDTNVNEANDSERPEKALTLSIKC